jgi:arsenate reductase
MQTSQVLDDLQTRFHGSFDGVTLRAELQRTMALFGHEGGGLDPLLVGYLVDRLRAIAAGHALQGISHPTVLFVCVHNAGRSQMASSLLRDRAPHVTVLSAGSAPAEKVNPVVVEAMSELGIDLRHAEPARLELATVQRADLAVTMGCGDACPVLPGTAYLDWALADPAGQPLSTVRLIRDDIARRVDALVEGLR